MPIHLEHPEGIAGPSVVSVTIEDDGVIITDPFATHEPGEGVFVDVVADDLVLQLVLPVHFDGAGDVTDIVQQDVFV
jgi:hypothetical protein